MKTLFMACVLSITSVFLNQGYGYPILEGTDEEIIMQNSWIAVKISKATGEISSFNYWHSYPSHELLTDTAFIIIRDKRNNNEYRQSDGEASLIDTVSYPPDSVRVVFDVNFGLPPPAEYPYSIRIIYSLGTQAFHWDAELRTGLTPDREANIDFSIPVIANMDYAFWTKDNAPFKLPLNRIVRYRKLYDVWTVIPTIILFNDTTDVGLSFVSPIEMRKPKLEWVMKKDSFTIANSYLRLSQAHPCSAAVYIVPHEADWRPGLAWIYDKYSGYFNPVSESVIKGEGWQGLVDERPGPAFFDTLRMRGVKWIRFDAHHPFLGLYAPPDKNKWIIISEKNDMMPYDFWKGDSWIDTERHTTYDSNKTKIGYLHNDSIQTYMYFQSFESWKQYAKPVFTEDIAIGANDETLPAWRQCYLMNPDPDGPWGLHIKSQIVALLDSYPKMNGIFYDRDDYCDYDYKHEDGVTMIGESTAYMRGFALEKMNDTLLKIVHEHDIGTAEKGVWTNGPTSVEVCKNMDGIMSEALYQAPLLQYLGITRPLILEPYDTTPQQTETKLKTALWTGHFPSIAWYRANPTCLTIDSNYRPLFSLYKGKKWVLYPHALQLPEGIKGNIFKIPDSIDPAGPVPDTDYLVAMIDPERYSCKVYPEPETTHDIFRYDRLAKVGKPGSDEIKYCYLLSGDYKGINQVSIQSNPPQTVLEVNIPAHRVSSLIQLSKEPRYEVTRTSSPVLTRGESEEFVIKVQNIGEEPKNYNIQLITPFGQTSAGFS